MHLIGKLIGPTCLGKSLREVRLATYIMTSFSKTKLVNCTLSVLYILMYGLFIIIFRRV